MFLPVIPRWRSQNPAVRTCHPPETHTLQHGAHTWNALPPVGCLRVMLSCFTNCSPLFLQYLSCLTTSRSLTDKLAFDVGLQEDSTGSFRTLMQTVSRTCWFQLLNCTCLSQERPAGGPSIQPPSRGLKERRSGWEMTSFLSVFLQSVTW